MTAGFPIGGRLVGGAIIGKRAKNCMKITKSTFLGQNSRRPWGASQFFGTNGNTGQYRMTAL